MKSFFKYFKVQLKRLIKYYPKPLSFLLILSICLAGIGAIVMRRDREKESMQKIQVGVVGDMTNSYLEFGFAALQNMDSTRFSMDFLKLDEEKAKDMLRAGEIACYLFLPDNFAESAIHGEYIPAVVVTDSASPAFSSAIVKEAAKMAEVLVLESQNGVFGAQLFIENRTESETAYYAIQDLALDYVSVILARDSVFETRELGVSENLSLPSYYICALGVFLFMMFGAAFAPVLTKKDSALESLLISRGTGVFSQCLCEWLAYSAVIFFTLLAVCLGAGAASLSGVFDTGSILPDLKSFFALSIKLAPAAVCIASLHLFIYGLARGMVEGIIAQLLTALFLGYISGCFYPSSFFPKVIREISLFLPSGAALSYTARCIGGAGEVSAPLAVLAGYTVLLFSASVLIRKKRLRRYR